MTGLMPLPSSAFDHLLLLATAADDQPLQPLMAAHQIGLGTCPSTPVSTPISAR